ncbi:MAG: low molecular weight phosphatase family protein [Vicinamibacterales bacterium]
MTTVLFACVQNAGRSQMAAALFNRAADPARARAISAGTRPAAAVHPEVAATLADLGLDVSGVRPQRLTDALASQAQVLVTMGCGDACPIVPGARTVDWQIADPHGQPPDAVRAIRDHIARLVDALVDELGVGRGT